MTKANILIVEDESIVAEDIRFSLEANGYAVCDVLDSGEEALKWVGRLQPDLVLLDIQLRGELDGTQTAQRIWDEHGIPVVYLTAHSDEATLERAKWTRPFAYLLKPFEERELCVTVEIALSKRPLAPLLELPRFKGFEQIQRLLADAAFSPEPCVLVPENGLSIKLSDSSPPDWIQQVDDRSLDLLEIVLLLWWQLPERAEKALALTADDILRLRGLKQQKSGSGSRAGYEDKWRREVALQLELLGQLEIGLQGHFSPMLKLNVTASDYQWQLSPGQGLLQLLLADSPQTLLFSQRLLEYDPYRQKWEKRLGRLLSWQWASGGSDLYPVGELLHCLRVPIDQKNPLRTKERLELALETLKHDQVLGLWEYLNPAEEQIGKRGWLNHWMQWELRIVAPAHLQAAPVWRPTQADPDARPLPQASDSRKRSFGFIKHIRKERGLSQAEVASAIGLTQAQLSKIESGSGVQQATAEKIKRWILEDL